MKAQIKVAPNLIIEVEATKQKDLFKLVASSFEVYGEKVCGLCGSTNIVPTWRTVNTVKGRKTETYEYAEFVCKDCRARLALGTINDDTGTLFPQRKLRPDGQPVTKEDRENGVEGQYGKHNGWHRFEGKRQNQDEPQD